jgi:S1-C subfamily serine protease
VQLLNAVAELVPGSQATISVQRGRETLELDVQVAQRPKLQRRMR